MSLLTHLPESKQQEIGEILSIIKEEAKPEKVILFGSHVSDKWGGGLPHHRQGVEGAY